MGAVANSRDGGQDEAEGVEQLILRLWAAVLAIVVRPHVLVHVLDVLEEAGIENDVRHDRAVNSESLLLDISVQVPGVPLDYEKSVVVENNEELELSMSPCAVYGEA